MIKLTLQGYYQDDPTKSVFVNPNLITYMTLGEATLYKKDPKTGYLTTAEAKKVSVTIISFAAGLRDESDSINVLESPETIMEMIK